MTVPTPILIGELDDWTPANECRAVLASEPIDQAAPRGVAGTAGSPAESPAGPWKVGQRSR